jgi:hypothetical protein
MKSGMSVLGMAAAGALLAAGLGLGCSNASRTLEYSSPSPDPGVVYVAEQVYGLDDWARAPDSRSYASITTRGGEPQEGRLVRINSSSVVMAEGRNGPERTVAKDDILFMRVWW